jgi:prepilin-type N-terminal cleavage/methylation domain-containing protein
MNKRGFTLIEIIIVIVILGILATLALPRITGQMESSKGAEAMNMFGAIRRAAVNCADMADGIGTSCVTWANLGMRAPEGAKFSYKSKYDSNMMKFTAISNAGSSAGKQICLQVNQSNGSAAFTYSDTAADNVFSGIVSKVGTPTGACLASYDAME